MNAQKSDAFALIIVLVFLSVIVIMVDVMYEAIFCSQRAKLIQQNGIKAIDVAESALVVSLERITKNADYAGEKIDIIGGTAHIKIHKKNDIYKLEIVALYPVESSIQEGVTLTAEIFRTDKDYEYRNKSVHPPLPAPLISIK